MLSYLYGDTNMGTLIDLTGQKFGKLYVISKCKTAKYINGEILWNCICSCEKKTKIIVCGSQLRGGRKKSCGCYWKPTDTEYLRKLHIKLIENSKLISSTQCIEYTGFRDKNGYGKICVTRNGKERAIPVSRISWQIYKGPIPSGMLVCHHCDNPACIRIEHLFLGTSQDNITDKIHKDRQNQKLNNEKARYILKMKGTKTSHQLAKKFKVSDATIKHVWQRKTWKHVRIDQ
jgi:hypothetical protein